MNAYLTQLLGSSFQSLLWAQLAINAILHLVFAAAVAKDAGLILKQGRTTWLVSGLTWALATLMGGVIIAAVYWFIHYSNVVRQFNKTN